MGRRFRISYSYMKTRAGEQFFVNAYDLYERMTGGAKMPLKLMNAVK